MSETSELHERRVTIEIEPVEGGRLAVHAELRDERKVEMTSFRGPLAPGVVHHMKLDAELDETLTIRSVDTRMDTIPFERSNETRGEGCRDILPGYQKLVGTRMDPSYALRVNELVGGPFGCFHILSLAQCLPLAVQAATAAGERRALAREMRIGAFADASPHLGMSGRLRDEHREGGRAADLGVRLAVPRFEIVDASVGGLVGLSITRGFTRAALDVLEAGESATAPQLSALVIALTPVVPQASAAFSGHLRRERHFSAERGSPQVDSCHMWRADGPVVSLIRELSPPAMKKL